MVRSLNPRRREAEKRFPYRVDIPVPDGGLGGRLTEMMYWCREHVSHGAWEQHGHMEQGRGVIPVHVVRFYFMIGADAEAFRQRWAGG